MTTIPTDSLPVSQDLVDTVIDTLEPELSLAVLDGTPEDVADVVRQIARPLLVAERRYWAGRVSGYEGRRMHARAEQLETGAQQ